MNRRANLSRNSDGRRPGVGGWLLLCPLLAWVGLFVVAPAVILLIFSFCEQGETWLVEFSFTTENYRRAVERDTDEAVEVEPGEGGIGSVVRGIKRVMYEVEQRTYLKLLLRSIGYAAATTAICLLAGYPVGWFIARRPVGSRNVLLMLIMIPFWTSFLIRTYGWITILSSSGPLDAILRNLHLISAPLDLLYTPAAVLIGLVYTFLPFMILPIYTNAEKFDNSMSEAAMDLGATPIRVFWHVILPLTRAGVATGCMLVFIPALGMFAVNDLLGGARVKLIGNVIQEQFTGAGERPFGAALATLLLVIFGLVYFLLRRQLR